MYVKESGAGLDELKDAITFMKSHKLLIGIPEKRASRKNEKLTNVDLAYIHSQGSPKHAIPARPFLEPAINDVKDEIADRMKEAVIQAIDGNDSAALARMHEAGQTGEIAAKRYFKSGKFTPNAPITISGGWMRNKVSRKLFYVKGKGNEPPLIDTGNLQGSITHIVEGE